MSNLSDDTLHKILQQIQTQAVTSQRSLSLVNAQIQSKTREKKILELTTRQLEAIPKDDTSVRMYTTVGKAFILTPRSTISYSQANETKSLSEDISSLQKKGKYLEKQVTDAQNQMKDIFHHSQRQQQQ